MKNILTKIVVALLASITITAFAATDSTEIYALNVKPKVQSYLLEHGWVTTEIGNYFVDTLATTKRCNESTTPTLLTNIASIQVYGHAQAIEGVQNTLSLDPLSYKISGAVSAPVNVAARDNGVQISWQIWCVANESV